MSLCVLNSRAREGIGVPAVTVEVHVAGGLPTLSIVGLPEAAVRESKDRVRGALLNSHFRFPADRVTINLAPADLPKEGGRFDLPIALGVLGASDQLRHNSLGRLELIGELALSGNLCPVAGVLPVALAARKAGRALILPRANAKEAALVSGLVIYPAKHLLEVCEHLNGTALLSPFERRESPAPSVAAYPDLAEVRGQEQAEARPGDLRGRQPQPPVSRAAEFPARFQLVAAMNPCPCGYLGDAGARCDCTAEQVARYRARISRPLLNRIDL